MKSVREDTFYKIIDNAEGVSLPEDMHGYYPSVEELEFALSEASAADLLPTLAFFAADPYKDNKDAVIDYEDYLKSVEFCKKKLLEVEILD